MPQKNSPQTDSDDTSVTSSAEDINDLCDDLKAGIGNIAELCDDS